MKLLNENGGGYFWQWDTGQKITIVGGDVCGHALLSNCPKTPALRVIIQEEGGVRTITVPDTMLQSAEPITVHVCECDAEGGTTTHHTQRFPVLTRPKPDDYVYTPGEIKTWDALAARVDALEGEGLAQAVAEYLEENPVEAGATAEEAAQIEANAAAVERLTTNKLDADKLPEAVNDALAKAKTSGEFDGKDGDPGPAGADGKPGADGKDYVLTEYDKTEIAGMAAEMVEVPTDEHINNLINTALGVIENGTY